jgi:hypothetical protein
MAALWPHIYRNSFAVHGRGTPQMTTGTRNEANVHRMLSDAMLQDGIQLDVVECGMLMAEVGIATSPDLMAVLTRPGRPPEFVFVEIKTRVADGLAHQFSAEFGGIVGRRGSPVGPSKAILYVPPDDDVNFHPAVEEAWRLQMLHTASVTGCNTGILVVSSPRGILGSYVVSGYNAAMRQAHLDDIRPIAAEFYAPAFITPLVFPPSIPAVDRDMFRSHVTQWRQYYNQVPGTELPNGTVVEGRLRDVKRQRFGGPVMYSLCKGSVGVWSLFIYSLYRNLLFTY